MSAGTYEIHLDDTFGYSTGVTHRTRAPERTVVVMIEQRGVIPTGD